MYNQVAPHVVVETLLCFSCHFPYILHIVLYSCEYYPVSLSQIRYLLVVILGLNSVSGVQYKDMMINR